MTYLYLSKVQVFKNSIRVRNHLFYCLSPLQLFVLAINKNYFKVSKCYVIDKETIENKIENRKTRWPLMRVFHDVNSKTQSSNLLKTYTTKGTKDTIENAFE